MITSVHLGLKEASRWMLGNVKVRLGSEGNKECGFLRVWEASGPWVSLLLFPGNKPRVRSIRFAAGHDAEGSQSHVHFDEKLHDSVVMVTQESDSSFLVKVCVLLPHHQLSLSTSSCFCLTSWACLLPSLSWFIGTSLPVPETCVFHL